MRPTLHLLEQLYQLYQLEQLQVLDHLYNSELQNC